eukprot:1483711-Amphidinium_carterae.1
MVLSYTPAGKSTGRTQLLLVSTGPPGGLSNSLASGFLDSGHLRQLPHNTACNGLPIVQPNLSPELLVFTEVLFRAVQLKGLSRCGFPKMSF